MNKIFSVISVTYNAVDTIERMILSVIRQNNFFDIELIIIDGCSNDGTVDIIKKYNKYITYWISEKDKGIYDAMNKGLNIAKGDYVYFLGADDWLCNKDVFCNIKKYFDGKYDVISGKVYFCNEKLKIRKIVGGKFSKKEILTGKMGPHQGMFIKRKVALEYKFSTKYRITSDYEMFLRMFLDGKTVLFISDVIANFNITGISSHLEISRNEYIDILKTHVSEEAVTIFIKRKKENFIKSFMKKKIKQIIFYLNLERKIKKLLGWEKY